MAELKLEINQYLDQLPREKLELVHAFVAFLLAQAATPQATVPTAPPATTTAQLDCVMGKYARLPNSSDRFADQKHLEIALEEPPA